MGEEGRWEKKGEKLFGVFFFDVMFACMIFLLGAELSWDESEKHYSIKPLWILNKVKKYEKKCKHFFKKCA